MYLILYEHYDIRWPLGNTKAVTFHKNKFSPRPWLTHHILIYTTIKCTQNHAQASISAYAQYDQSFLTGTIFSDSNRPMKQKTKNKMKFARLSTILLPHAHWLLLAWHRRYQQSKATVYQVHCKQARRIRKGQWVHCLVQHLYPHFTSLFSAGQLYRLKIDFIFEGLFHRGPGCSKRP